MVKQNMVKLHSCTAWEPGSLILVATGRSSQMSYQSCFFLLWGESEKQETPKSDGRGNR